MNKERLIAALIKDTINRAIRETAACLIVIAAFAYFLQSARIGSPQYYGCLLIMIASGFVAGVIWSFTLSYGLLRTHPVSDKEFWHEVFLAQARLLRLVPLWYLAPLCSGMLLFFAPTSSAQFSHFIVNFAVVTILFGGITSLNRHSARKIEEQAWAVIA